MNCARATHFNQLSFRCIDNKNKGVMSLRTLSCLANIFLLFVLLRISLEWNHKGPQKILVSLGSGLKLKNNTILSSAFKTIEFCFSYFFHYVGMILLLATVWRRQCRCQHIRLHQSPACNHVLPVHHMDFVQPYICYSCMGIPTDCWRIFEKNGMCPTTIIQAPRHWPLWGEFTGDWWIPRIDGQ